MTVFLVHCQYFDYNECSGGSMLRGVYSSMEKAIEARNAYIAAEIAECAKMHCDVRESFDYQNNPVIDRLVNGEIVEGNSYTISEWPLE